MNEIINTGRREKRYENEQNRGQIWWFFVINYALSETRAVSFDIPLPPPLLLHIFFFLFFFHYFWWESMEDGGEVLSFLFSSVSFVMFLLLSLYFPPKP